VRVRADVLMYMGALLSAVVDCANELNRSGVPACTEENVRPKTFEGGKEIS
jgi:predicted TPR repeat methyltransferase